jgi:hypothetical protein
MMEPIAEASPHFEKTRGRVISALPGVFEYPLAKARREKQMANWALSTFTDAVGAVLVGLDSEARAVLALVTEWLQLAIIEHEIPPRDPIDESGDYHFGCVHCTLGLCRWLQSGEVEVPLFEEAADRHVAHAQASGDRWEMARALPVLLPARRFQQTVDIARAERLTADVAARIKSPGKMAYLYALSALTESPDDSVLRKTLEAFLRYQLAVSTGIHRSDTGLWEDVPLWMLIHHLRFGESGRNPFEVTRGALIFLR